MVLGDVPTVLDPHLLLQNIPILDFWKCFHRPPMIPNSSTCWISISVWDLCSACNACNALKTQMEPRTLEPCWVPKLDEFPIWFILIKFHWFRLDLTDLFIPLFLGNPQPLTLAAAEFRPAAPNLGRVWRVQSILLQVHIGSIFKERPNSFFKNDRTTAWLPNHADHSYRKTRWFSPDSCNKWRFSRSHPSISTYISSKWHPTLVACQCFMSYSIKSYPLIHR